MALDWRQATVLAYHAAHPDVGNPGAATLDAFTRSAHGAYADTVRRELRNPSAEVVAVVCALAAVNGGGTPATKAKRACAYFERVFGYLAGWAGRVADAGGVTASGVSALDVTAFDMARLGVSPDGAPASDDGVRGRDAGGRARPSRPDARTTPDAPRSGSSAGGRKQSRTGPRTEPRTAAHETAHVTTRQSTRKSTPKTARSRRTDIST